MIVSPVVKLLFGDVVVAVYGCFDEFDEFFDLLCLGFGLFCYWWCHVVQRCVRVKVKGRVLVWFLLR